MARELKVFGITLITSGDESKRLGQRSHIRQCRAVVAATTRKEAMDKFGITTTEARDHMGENGNEQDVAKAMSKPGQVFISALDSYVGERLYLETQRTPHVPLKRGRRISYEERKAMWDKADAERAARAFTDEEFQHMIEMFAGANHPLSASIAEKARLNLIRMDD